MRDIVSKDFVIVDLSWERIFLNIDIKADFDGDVEFKLRWFDRKTKIDKHVSNLELIREITWGETVGIKYKNHKDGIYSFSINLAAVQDRTFINNGKWHILAVTNEGEYICSVEPKLNYLFDDLSRVFRYGGGKYAYNISFSSYSEDEVILAFVLNSYFLIANKKWRKRKYIQEALTFGGKFNRTYLYAVIVLIRIYYHIVAALSPKKGKKILFMSETKDYLVGNLKYIDDNMKARGLDKQFKITYSNRRAVGLNMSVFSWIKVVTSIARQDVIFIDDYAPVFGFLNLDKRTKLIQVWHAGEGFKAVGYCRFGKEGTPFPAGSAHKKYTHVLTGSKKLVHIFEEVFGIEEDAFYPLGMPRLDGFLDPETIREFKERFYGNYPQLKNKKIILFAPTFRGTGQKMAYYDYTKLDFKEIYDFCGDEYVFLIKMHPFVVDPTPIPKELQDRIYDFTEYPNINELYYITELLITDYSSNYFEYALMEKPVVFYTYDREIYELTRGVHRSVKESAPGKVCDTFEELMQCLSNKDFQVEKIKQFVEENFSEYDGKASEKAIDQILLGKEI